MTDSRDPTAANESSGQMLRPARRWDVRSGWLAIDRPLVMGVLNVTPDSFSDGGLYANSDAAVTHAEAMIDQGADVIDVGGESTRPGAAPIDAEEQERRVLPVIRLLARRLAERTGAPHEVQISIDTTRASVAAAALDVGASVVNDVSGGTDDPPILSVAARHGAGLVLMHRLVAPRDDAYSDRHARPPAYGDVVAEVGAALRERRAAAIGAGVRPTSIVGDPGLGFGKDVAQNIELMARIDELVAEHPLVLVGASRKSFIGAIAARAGAPIGAAGRGSGTRLPGSAHLASTSPGTTPPASERLGGSIAAAVLCLAVGATVFRVHDVAAARQSLDVAAALLAVRQAHRAAT